MENPKAFIKQAWLKKHGKTPSPKIVNEIIALAEKSHARDKAITLDTHIIWWNRLYINESKIVKGKFSYYHDDGSIFTEKPHTKKTVTHTTSVRTHAHAFRESFAEFLAVFIKWIALTFAGGVFLAVGLFFLVKTFPLIVQDQKPSNDSDLRFAGVVVPEEDNAFSGLSKAKDSIKSPVVSPDVRQARETLLDTIVVGQGWDDTFVKENIAYNREAIDGFYQAAQKNVFLSSAFASDFSQIDIFAKSGTWTGYPKLAKLAALDALALVKAKKDNAGMDKAFLIVRTGYLIEHAEHGPLMQYLVGTAVKNIGLRTIQTIANTGRFTVKERAAYARALEQYRNDGSEIASFFEGEYATMSGLLREVGAGTLLHNQNLASGGTKVPTFAQVVIEYLQKAPSFYFYEHETRAAIAEATRAFIADAMTACDASPVRLATTNLNDASTASLVITRNALGKLLVERFIEAAPIFKENLCQQKILIDETAQVILSKKK